MKAALVSDMSVGNVSTRLRGKITAPRNGTRPSKLQDPKQLIFQQNSAKKYAKVERIFCF
jgi:hypothetical protein